MNHRFTASQVPGPVPRPVSPPVTTGCSVPAQPLNIYFTVDCDWEKARSTAALSFLPFFAPGQMYIMCTGNQGIEPLVNPPNGLGLSDRNVVLRMIDNDLRPRICTPNNFQPGQISRALQRIISEQRGTNRPFIVYMFTDRAENHFNQTELQNLLNQIKTMQQGRGITNIAYSGENIPQNLIQLQSQNLIALNSVFNSARYVEVISDALCSQLQSALG